MSKYIILYISCFVILYGDSFAIRERLALIDADETLLINSILKEQSRVRREREEKSRRDEISQVESKREIEIEVIESSLSKLTVIKKSLNQLLEKKIEQTKRDAKKARELALKRKRNRIVAHIDISLQNMKVYQGGKLLYKWLVSTARKGYSTPVGKYKPQYIEKMHYSSLYHNSPMPYTVFFHGNYAIHGTNSISKLGFKASHGCVRLHPKNAKVLYSMIKKFGKSNTEIKITY